MPQDRLRSPTGGQGRRLTMLTDFEFRVWDQYQLSSDDYGVMRCSAIKLMADNMSLEQRPMADVQAALERLIDVKLVAVFEHQGQRFICQIDWQKFQKVEFPRKSDLPKPPSKILATCDKATQDLFSSHPGGFRPYSKRPGRHSATLPNEPEVIQQQVAESSATLPNEPEVIQQQVAESSVIVAEDLPKDLLKPLALAVSVSRQPLAVRVDVEQERFDQFWAAFPKKVGKDAAWRVWQKKKPRLEAVLSALAWQVRQDDWTKDHGQFIPYPATYLNAGRWLDQPTSAPVATRRVNGCFHKPPCANEVAHTKLKLAEADVEVSA